jgi:adenylate cyclase
LIGTTTLERPVQRKLAAILAADIVGYSHLMEIDEAGTLARLKSARELLIGPKIAASGGRVVKLIGDGMLVEFPSVVDAVTCAVEIQRAIHERSELLQPDERLELRIGVNLGDVIVDGEDIYGDGVNIAARLEGLCEPGGVLISGTAFDQIERKLNYAFEFLGSKRVKNIETPVRLYRVPLGMDGTPRAPVVRGGSYWPFLLAGVAAVLLMLAGGALLWKGLWGDTAPKTELASTAKMALPLPNKPSVAVLPFENLSGDRGQDYFADGMTDDLITDLSRLSGVFVISRNSTWDYKNKPTKVQQVAEELGVLYVLQGSVRRVGDQLRINAQLVDARNGHQLWAERYDGSANDVFALQDKVVQRIVEGLAINLTGEERTQVAEAETSVPQAYDAFLQGWDLYRRETTQDAGKAIDFFEQAIRLDPQYSRAYAALAAVYLKVVTLYWQPAVGIEYERAYAGLHQNLAKAMEKPSSLAYSVSAEFLARQGRSKDALAQIDRALILAPNEANTHVSRARILNATGRAAEAEKAVRLALRLNPLYGADYLTVLGQALLHQQRYEEAEEYIERAVNRQPENGQHYVTLAIIYGQLGRPEKARAAVKKYNDMSAKEGDPPLTVQEVGYWWYGNIFDYDEVYREKLRIGLRKAGVPEGAGSDIAYASLKRLIHSSDGEYDVEGATKIDVAQAKDLHTEGVVFVDVRGAGSFGAGHIPSAVNLEMSNGLSKESLSRLVDQDQAMAFYCFGKYCPRSTYACAKALLWGYKRVYYFAGGFPAWKNAGFPIETSLMPTY